jgi:tape measure domain-containing protein
MAKRDVELVIRAKNEASKAVDQVNAALTELTKIQGNLTRTGQGAESTLNKLGSTLSNLSGAVKGLQAFDQVASKVDAAGKSVQNLEKDLTGAQNKLGQLNSELKSTSDSLGQYQSKLDAAQQKQKAQTDSLRASQTALKETNRELRTAESAYNRLNSRIQATTQPSQELTQRFAEQSQRVSELRVQQARYVQTVTEQKTALSATRTEVAGLNSAVRQTQQTEQALSNDIERATQRVQQQTGSLEKAKGAFAELSATADKAKASIAAVAGGGAKADVERLAQTLANVARYSTGTGFSADPKLAANLRTQREEIAQTAARLRELQTAAQSAFGAMRTAGLSTTGEMVSRFNALTGAARAAKGELASQNAALAQLQGSARSSFAAWSQGVRAAGGDTALLTRTFNQASATARTLGSAVVQTGSAAAETGRRMSSVFSGFNSEGRTTLSLMQRLRGEFLALASSAIGFYAAIQQTSKVVDAFQILESVQSRLGVVFQQDTSAVAKEIEFLNRQASRLGVSFQVLGNEYSKFAIATQAANISTSETRKIFLSVAEAGRVNKLSMDQMSGIFLAMTQMMSKGKVTAEELRGQLGERLPGAFNIMADALGVTTQELDKMMQAGDILANRDTMLKFANELDRRFGSQLAASLKSTTAEIGRFQNELFNAYVRVGEGGFIEAFTRGLQQLNSYFDSRAGRDFFLSLGAASGKFVDALAGVAKNLDIVAKLVGVFVSIKLAVWVSGAVTAIAAWYAGLTSVAGAAAGATMRTQTLIASSTTLTAVVNGSAVAARGFGLALNVMTLGLSGAIANSRVFQATLTALGATAVRVATVIRGLFAALGGWIGIVVGLGSFFASQYVTSWATQVDGATRNLDEHRRIMGEVNKAYEQVGKKTEDWGKAIKNVTADQANANLRNLIEEYKKIVTAMASSGPQGLRGLVSDADAISQAERISAMNRALAQGKVPIETYIKNLQELYSNTQDDRLRRWIETLLESARKGKEVADAIDGAANASKALNQNVDQVEKTLGRTARTMEQVVNATDDSTLAFKRMAEEVKKAEAALDKLKEGIPALARELKYNADVAAAYKTLQEVLQNSSATEAQKREALTLYSRNIDTLNDSKALADIKEIAGNTKILPSLVNIIKNSEGFSPTAYPDGRGYSVGYGFQTVGGVPTTAGTTMTREEADRELIRQLARFGAAVDKLVKVPISDDQRNALISYAYNAGPGALQRDGILEPLNKGDYAAAAQAIINGVTTSMGRQVPALVRRRQEEGALFLRGSQDPAVQAEIVAREQERIKLTEEVNQKLAARIEILKAENANGGQITRDAYIQREIQSLINEEKKKGIEVDATQVAELKKQLGIAYDIAQAKRDAKTAASEETEEVKKANAASALAVSLMQRRTELVRQINEASKNLDGGREAALKQQLTEINAKLTEAITNARGLWTAIGGEQAEVQLQKLANIELAIDRINAKWGITAKDIGRLLSNGLVNAFDKFAQAVAKGENVLKALGDAFMQFAADFLREIAKMILKQAILNALKAFGLNGLAAGVGLAHSGGIAGSQNRSRSVSPSVFANAMRYHSGGVAGLKANEVPAILERGEEILTRDDPRHMFNGGGQSAAPQAPSVMNTKIINAFDASSFLSEALSGRVGEQAILNFVRANSGAVRGALGV